MLGLTNIVLWASISCEEEAILSILKVESKGFSTGILYFIRASSKDLIFAIRTYFSISKLLSLCRWSMLEVWKSSNFFEQFNAHPQEFSFFHQIKIDRHDKI
jgi:hypothetical protein